MRFFVVFGINNEIRKEYLGTGYCKHHHFRPSNDQNDKKYTYFVKYVTFLLYIEKKKSFLH